MNGNKINHILSPKRFQRYLLRCENNSQNALQYYLANTKIAESTYWSLHVFEIALRNKIHFALTRYFKTDEWYNQWLTSDNYSDFHRKIITTKEMLKKRKEEVNPDKMVAEFTLGFWVQMFNAQYEYLLWKPLRTIFSNMPKTERKRKNITKALNWARNFRNRSYHYEPICWDFLAVQKNYKNVIKLVEWLDDEGANWCKQNCDFPKTITTHTQKLSSLGVKKITVITNA